MQNELTITVYVLAFQHKTQGEGVGGFDWFVTREQAEKVLSERKREDWFGPDYEYAIFPYHANEAITRAIDADYIDLLSDALSTGLVPAEAPH